MFAVKRSNFLGRILPEYVLRGNAFASSGPHVSHVKILGTVIVIIEPGNSHTGADVFNSCLRSNISESPIAVISVEILAAEIVRDIEVGPAVAVVITPSTAKTVTRVVLVEARFRSHIAERAVSVIPHHEIGRAVLGVVIGNRILVLIRSLVIDVKAKINVQPSIAVVVGGRCPRKGSLRSIVELKRIGLLTKLTAPLIQE